jgi:hypothetical protein
MGLLDWLGLGGAASTVPVVVLAGTHMGGCKALINRVVAGLDPSLRISAVLYDTPYDDTIADLSRSLDATRIYFGDADHRREMEARADTAEEIYRSAAPAAVAKRTIFNSKAAGARNFTGSKELVHAVESGRQELAAIPKAQLPAELRPLSDAELAAHIADRSRERKALQARINELATKRQRFIEEQVKKEKDGGTASLDNQLYRCIQTQAAPKGIVYSDGPAY